MAGARELHGGTADVQRPRAREIGLLAGDLPAGPQNAITNVPGVLVGHATLFVGEGALRPESGPVRLCVRAAVGVVRTGGFHGHASRDFVIGLSVAHCLGHVAEVVTRAESVAADEARAMQWLFPAVAEGVEEAILNSLCRATTVVGGTETFATLCRSRKRSIWCTGGWRRARFAVDSLLPTWVV